MRQRPVMFGSLLARERGRAACRYSVSWLPVPPRRTSPPRTRRPATQYKASITVPDCPGPERVLTMSAMDIDTLLEVVKDVLPCLSDEGEENLDIRLLIHQSRAGCVIGKGGSKIKELREKTGARLKIFSNPAPQSTARVVQLVGGAESVAAGVREVLELIKPVPIMGPVHNYDPHNYDDYYADEYGGFGIGQEGGGPRGGRGGPPRGPGPRGMPPMGPSGRGPPPRGPPMDRSGPTGSRSGFNDFGGPPQRGRFSGGPSRGGFGGGNSGSSGGFGSGGGGFGGGGGGFGSGGGSFGSGGGGFGSGGGGFGSGGGFGGGGGGFGGSRGSGGSGGGMGGMGGMGAMGGMGSGGGGFGNNTGNNQQETTTQVTIPKDLAGAIIGKAGSRIRKIRVESGAGIEIAEPLPGADERVITITGTPPRIQMAQYLLQQSVHESNPNLGRGNF